MFGTNARKVTFEVYAVRTERGVFITQERCERIGTIEARNIVEAQKAAELLYPNMGAVRVTGYMGR